MQEGAFARLLQGGTGGVVETISNLQDYAVVMADFWGLHDGPSLSVPPAPPAKAWERGDGLLKRKTTTHDFGFFKDSIHSRSFTKEYSGEYLDEYTAATPDGRSLKSSQ